MKARNAMLALVVGVISSLGSGTASAGFISGNFATGDLTGWTASAIDQNGHSVTPLISVGSSGGMNFAVFDTGNYATGPFVSTLSQSFLDATSQDDGSRSGNQFTNAATSPVPTPNPTPEPSSLVLAVIGGMTSLLYARRRRRQARSRVRTMPNGSVRPSTHAGSPANGAWIRRRSTDQAIHDLRYPS